MEFERKNKRAKKLTASDVAEMRGYYANGATQGALSRHFGVTIGQVGRIVRGESWQEGAGQRQPTQEEIDDSARRLLALQEQINARAAADVADPLAAEVLGGVMPRVERKPPPSLLDGGDAPEETDGSALARLALEGQSTVEGMDALLGPEGPYNFVRSKETK